MLNRAIFLDRDGVINAMWLDPEHGLVDSPANPDQFHLLPRAAEAIRCINQMGFLAVVVSNQPGIAKRKLSPTLLEAISAKMVRECRAQDARLDAIYYCLHHPEALLPQYRENCQCRKPMPGLLLQAAKEMQIDLPGSYMIGDGFTDIQAGKRAGCKTVWIGKWKCDTCEVSRRYDATPDLIAADLWTAIQTIQTQEQDCGNLYR